MRPGHDLRGALGFHLPGAGAGGARGRLGAFLGAQASLDGQRHPGLGSIRPCKAMCWGLGGRGMGGAERGGVSALLFSFD